MAAVLAGNWWAWILRGVLAIIFGILTFMLPQTALLTLTLLFAGYAVVEGIINSIAAVSAPKGAQPQRWWILLLEGIVSVAAGFVTILYPGITILVFVTLIGIWAVITGVFEIVAAIRLRKQIEGEWLLVIMGIFSVIFGGVFLFLPVVGALTLAFYIGAYALIFGVLLIALGFKLRNWGKTAVQNP